MATTMDNDPHATRRRFLGDALSLGAAGCLPALLRPRLASAQPTVPATGTHLVLLGTQGGPNFNTERNEAANAVVVDGQIYLVDIGEGGLAALRKVGLNYRNVARVFLTHLHDDHHGDLLEGAWLPDRPRNLRRGW